VGSSRRPSRTVRIYPTCAIDAGTPRPHARNKVFGSWRCSVDHGSPIELARARDRLRGDDGDDQL
jgi:hypothetical protein